MATSTKKSSAAAPGMPDLGELTKTLKQFKLPGVDASALVEWQRKDAEALAEAIRQAYEGMKALAERRSAILRENLAALQESMKGALDKGAMAKQGEVLQRGMKKAMKDFQELAALETKTRTDAWKVVQQRMQENMASLQALMKGKK